MIDVPDGPAPGNGRAVLVETAKLCAVDPAAERSMRLERRGERMARRAQWAAALGVIGLLFSSYLLAMLQYYANLSWGFLDWLFPEAFAESDVFLCGAVMCTGLVGAVAIVLGWRGAGRSNRLFRGLAMVGILGGILSVILAFLFVRAWHGTVPAPFIYVLF